MTDKSDIEALASAIYATANQFDAHRGELPAGYEDWADEIARDLRAHVEAARRLQPARVLEGYVSITDYPPPRNETVVYWHKQADGPGFPAIADEWRDEHHASFAAGWHPQASFAAPQPDPLCAAKRADCTYPKCDCKDDAAPQAEARIDFPGIGHAGPFPIVNGDVSIPPETMSDLAHHFRMGYVEKQAGGGKGGA